MKYTEYEMQDYYEEFDKWLEELCKQRYAIHKCICSVYARR